MYAIMGITGQIGGVIARTLLAANQSVRAVVRDTRKGQVWSEQGCEVALATIENAASLAAAFQGAEGVFILVPPNFDPLPGFPEARAIGKTLRTALVQANPARVVYLSTIGAQASEPKNEITPAKTQTPRIAGPDFISRATRLGTRKIPAPITMPTTIDIASSKPSLRGRSCATPEALGGVKVRTLYTTLL